MWYIFTSEKTIKNLAPRRIGHSSDTAEFLATGTLGEKERTSGVTPHLGVPPVHDQFTELVQPLAQEEPAPSDQPQKWRRQKGGGVK